MQNFSRKVVVTGIGPIASCGTGRDNFWQGILDKKTGLSKQKVHVKDDVWDEFYLHKVENFDINSFGLNQDDLDEMLQWKEGDEIIDQYYLMAAIKLALDDSGIDYKNHNDIGLVVTHENPGLEQFYWKVLNKSCDLFNTMKNEFSRKDFYQELYNHTVKSGYETQSFMSLYHIAKIFNVQKYSLYINNACASGLYAVETASQMIASGKVPIAVVSAGDKPDIFKYLWFKMLNMYEDEGKIRPFSESAKGFVMGEGAAGLVLEDYEHAKARGADIYAEYAGGGFRLEGWKVTMPKIGDSVYQDTINDALTQADISKDEIDLICAHGPGSKSADYYEAKAIMDVFGADKNVPVCTFKPYVGHNLGGSALLESAILLLCMRNNMVPPVLNTDKTQELINIDLVTEKRDVQLDTVIKICCAFAGYNAAAVFRRIT